ncbi:MAG: hypothetical protein IPJ14_11620 [Kineosporiaceae bacterium]|nr:hypothetical protein [Kineosporiaceae bacterium]MBK7623275.1 hypothetical protein [Kineosporiaceae bacterium]MBK8074773.1 hypothetical protein [Kineosporiaceae bacterium]
MTPFMLRIAELIGAETDEVDEPLAYKTKLSNPELASVGADKHVAIRALAEQLLCEANAVLADNDDHLGLFDEATNAELAFSVTYRQRAVRFSTRFVDGKAYAQLVGDGVEPGPPRELDGPDAVADLLVLLLVSAGLTHHAVEA